METGNAKTMNEQRYILEPYNGMKTRYHCPNCEQKDKTFARYIDTETGEHLHPSVGRCNRESNCGYHFTPKQFFHSNSTVNWPTPAQPYPKSKPAKPQQKPVSFISFEVFKASLKGYSENHFVKFLIDLFGMEITNRLISQYFIGTSKHWDGATVFWQIDTQGKIRTGKIMLYSPTTGKRVKEPFNHITWVHKAMKQPEFELRQCLFGEHLLQDKTKSIAIVESEKTAVIASVYLPQFLWLAVGSLNNLNPEKCRVLAGRTVILFPDLNGFEKWSKKAGELSQLARFAGSDLLERKATEAEKKQGFDLADYLVKFDYREFLTPEPMPAEQPPIIPLVCEVKPFEPNYYLKKRETPKPETWEQEITELEHFFKSIHLPTRPIKLNPCTTITNISKFIESHFGYVKAENGFRANIPYLHHLQELKQYLTVNSELI